MCCFPAKFPVTNTTSQDSLKTGIIERPKDTKTIVILRFSHVINGPIFTKEGIKVIV
jgi:hypothetical protein